MASDGTWQQFKLGEVCDQITDGKHGDCQDEAGSGYYFLSAKSVKDRRLLYETGREITKEDFEETHRRTRLEPGDILFTNTGTIGRMAIAPYDELTSRTTFQKSVALLKPSRSIVEPLFLYYLLWYDNARLSEFAHGTTQKNLLLKDFRAFPIEVPPLPTQKAIAHILGTLDDKIELNRQMNETLEATARALFKSWFVDFDPVRAKMDGQKPLGMDEETAGLFPDSFEQCDAGRIPAGWKVGTLLSQAELLSGGTPKTSIPEYWGGSIPWASAKDVSQCGDCFLIATERTITPAGLEKSATKIIEPYSTVVVARGATTGRMAMFGLPIAMNQTCYAVRSNIGCHFWQYNMTSHAMGSLVHSAHGSVFDTITTRTFQVSPVLVPPVDLARAFESRVEPLFYQILARQRESLTLTVIRDTLLPRLLSGEIRVAEAGKHADEKKAVCHG